VPIAAKAVKNREPMPAVATNRIGFLATADPHGPGKGHRFKSCGPDPLGVIKLG